MSKIELYNGDCHELIKGIPDRSIGFVCCDMPFNTTASAFDKNIIDLEYMWGELNRVIMPDRAIALFCSGQFMPKLLMSNPSQYKQDLIWYKSKRGNFVNARNRFMTAHETILIFSQANTANGSLNKMLYNAQGLIEKRTVRRDNGTRFGTMAGKRKSHKEETVSEYSGYPHDVLEFASVGKPTHPTEKPVSLLEFLIKSYTNEGDTVLDFCFGSCSCGEAAYRCNRDFIGFEKDESYFRMGEERIERVKSELTLF